jgi:hypothetical protein
MGRKSVSFAFLVYPQRMNQFSLLDCGDFTHNRVDMPTNDRMAQFMSEGKSFASTWLSRPNEHTRTPA